MDTKLKYKLTKIGWIPLEWDVKTLNELSNHGTQNGLYKPIDFYQYDGVEMVHMTEIFSIDEIHSGNMKKVLLTNDEIKKFTIEKGDLLFARRSLALDGVGKCALVGEIKGLMTFESSIIRVRPQKKLLYPRFGFYYIMSPLGRNEMLKYARQVAVSGITGEDLKKFRVVLPPLPEQRAIAACLSTWDSAIQKTTQLIAQKERRKKWLMQELLTGKRRLKGFGGGWKEYPYEKLLKVVKRPVEWNDAHLYNLISVRRRSGGIFLREALYGHQIKVKDLRTANEGDFLFSKMQILHGASALVTKEFAGAKISGSYIAVVAKDAKLLNMKFFQWYSQLPYFYHQTYISSYGVHIEKMTFDFDTFLALEMKLPSLEEQTAIAHLLQTADQEIQLLKAKVEKMKEQKKGVMQVLLTGKVRLKIST